VDIFAVPWVDFQFDPPTCFDTVSFYFLVLIVSLRNAFGICLARIGVIVPVGAKSFPVGAKVAARDGQLALYRSAVFSTPRVVKHGHLARPTGLRRFDQNGNSSC